MIRLSKKLLNTFMEQEDLSDFKITEIRLFTGRMPDSANDIETGKVLVISTPTQKSGDCEFIGEPIATGTAGWARIYIHSSKEKDYVSSFDVDVGDYMSNAHLKIINTYVIKKKGSYLHSQFPSNALVSIKKQLQELGVL